MYAVETKELSKCFGTQKAVDGLSLQVPEGSLYGFLGRNGAGKTTTIKMLTGLSRPTKGEICINGSKTQFGNRNNIKDIGYLPDVPGFYDWMNAVEFLEFSGRLFGMDKTALKADIKELLELVGLTGVKKRIGGYSRGMKQRLGIAQALINKPKVVFLDEPTSALDPIGRKEVIDIIASLKGKVTVFFSTHILSDVERICERVVIIEKGRAVIEDSIVSLREKHSVHGILLETDANGKSGVLLDDLRKTDWFKSAETSPEGGILVYVKDMKKAQIEIPGLVYSKGLALKKFNTLEPTLEDIFLKAVNNQ